MASSSHVIIIVQSEARVIVTCPIRGQYSGHVIVLKLTSGQLGAEETSVMAGGQDMRSAPQPRGGHTYTRLASTQPLSTHQIITGCDRDHDYNNVCQNKYDTNNIKAFHLGLGTLTIFILCTLD